MRLNKQTCTGCGYCVLVCPYDALKTDGWAEVIPEKCTDCNLCVYACPSDCFIPDAPLKPYRPRPADDYDVSIIGSGIGGLMAGVALAQAGYRVAVFEKLGFPGGRYTEIDYKGAAVTTGAWTNLGPKSHIGRFLEQMDINLKYASLTDADLTEQYTIQFPDGRHYNSLFDMLTPLTRKAWLKAILTGKRQLEQPASTDLDLVSAADYIAEFSDDDDLVAAVDAIAATASGLSSRAMPASEYIQITLDGRTAGQDFAMPVGGVRSIIKGLVTALRQAGGALFVRSPVAEICVAGNRATGIRLADGRQIRSRFVLHNGGPRAFVRLVGVHNLPADYVNRLSQLKGVECAALFGATREPLFTQAPITMTPHCQRVVGVFSPTLLDPTLSKSGLHLFDAFFPTYSDDRSTELQLALADMHVLFPHFDAVLEWSVPMFFTGTWAGTESGQTFGQTGQNRLDPATPVENCFLVGMDVKGSGVAGDLIPVGVQQLLEYLASKY
ncbi:MAG: FAD-dependent oxidoreductase [Anaerolineae bacterium]|nr:FAD-dependent oxidoreductase [Anaerolineae bacterium]